MNIFINALYQVSSGLMVPVIVGLFIMLVRSLLLIGGMFGMYSGRLQFNKKIAFVMDKFADNNPGSNDLDIALFKSNPTFYKAVVKMKKSQWKRVHGEKFFMDYETEAEKKISITKILMRIGPMLGLMGTLIPMGPALVSLGTGDISGMALNMQVAFATTVVGIFIGAIGFFCYQVQNRWNVEDLNNLEYLLNIMGG